MRDGNLVLLNSVTSVHRSWWEVHPLNVDMLRRGSREALTYMNVNIVFRHPVHQESSQTLYASKTVRTLNVNFVIDGSVTGNQSLRSASHF